MCMFSRGHVQDLWREKIGLHLSRMSMELVGKCKGLALSAASMLLGTHMNDNRARPTCACQLHYGGGPGRLPLKYPVKWQWSTLKLFSRPGWHQHGGGKISPKSYSNMEAPVTWPRWHVRMAVSLSVDGYFASCRSSANQLMLGLDRKASRGFNLRLLGSQASRTASL